MFGCRTWKTCEGPLKKEKTLIKILYCGPVVGRVPYFHKETQQTLQYATQSPKILYGNNIYPINSPRDEKDGKSSIFCLKNHLQPFWDSVTGLEIKTREKAGTLQKRQQKKRVPKGNPCENILKLLFAYRSVDAEKRKTFICGDILQPSWINIGKAEWPEWKRWVCFSKWNWTIFFGEKGSVQWKCLQLG